MNRQIVKPHHFTTHQYFGSNRSYYGAKFQDVEVVKNENGTIHGVGATPMGRARVVFLCARNMYADTEKEILARLGFVKVEPSALIV